MKSRKCNQQQESNHSLDDDYFVRIQNELEQLNLEHLRVLGDASDEDDSELCGGQITKPPHLRNSKRKARKKFVNPILLSAQFRDAFPELGQTPSQDGLTYVDCLLFEEERRRRRSNRHKSTVEHKWPKQIRIPAPVVEESLDAPKEPFNQAYDSAHSECEKKSPDSAFGSEDGSSNDPRGECLKDSFARVTSWSDIKAQMDCIKPWRRTGVTAKRPFRFTTNRRLNSPLLKSIDFQQLAEQKQRRHLKESGGFRFFTRQPRSADTDYDIPTPACSSDAESEERWQEVDL